MYYLLLTAYYLLYLLLVIFENSLSFRLAGSAPAHHTSCTPTPLFTPLSTPLIHTYSSLHTTHPYLSSHLQSTPSIHTSHSHLLFTLPMRPDSHLVNYVLRGASAGCSPKPSEPMTRKGCLSVRRIAHPLIPQRSSHVFHSRLTCHTAIWNTHMTCVSSIWL